VLLWDPLGSSEPVFDVGSYRSLKELGGGTTSYQWLSPSEIEQFLRHNEKIKEKDENILIQQITSGWVKTTNPDDDADTTKQKFEPSKSFQTLLHRAVAKMVAARYSHYRAEYPSVFARLVSASTLCVVDPRPKPYRSSHPVPATSSDTSNPPVCVLSHNEIETRPYDVLGSFRVSPEGILVENSYKPNAHHSLVSLDENRFFTVVPLGIKEEMLNLMINEDESETPERQRPDRKKSTIIRAQNLVSKWRREGLL